jgi:protein-tyrosine phosphatase
MIDIHCHILWGLDDGAGDMAEAVEMARIAYADGVRCIVATPHFTKDMLNTRETVERKAKELQRTLDELGIPVKIRAGNEVRLESEAFVIGHAEREQFGYLDAGKRFVLLEQRWLGYEPASPDIVKWFVARGIRPIIAHPERHCFFRDDPALLTALLDLGAWTQVSADSLLGKNGEEAKAFAVKLLREDRMHTLATDAHNVRRKPNLAEGFRWIREHAGAAKADAVLERMAKIWMEA